MRFLSAKPVGAWRNGGARALGARGCGFESHRPDHSILLVIAPGAGDRAAGRLASRADGQPKAPAITISCAVRIGSQTPSSRFESMTTVRSRAG